jgi:hypothetical protein
LELDKLFIYRVQLEMIFLDHSTPMRPRVGASAGQRGVWLFVSGN